MNLALSLAKTAKSIDEVPVGALIIRNQEIVGTGFNQRESLQDSCSHAELIAIQEACRNLGQWRLLDCTLVVTLEPCIMCTGAIIQSRIPTVIYGASDPKGGAMGSLYNLHNDPRLNHSVCVYSGVLQDPCSQILKDFFKKKRQSKPDSK